MSDVNNPAPCRILVVDDDSVFRVFVKTFLKDTGHQILFATDSIQATMIAVREKPDLLLLDVGLPGGDGFIVMQRLRTNSHTRHIPVIMTTASQDTSAIESKARLNGAAAYLAKPLTREKLRETIEQVLRTSKCSQSGSQQNIKPGNGR